MQGRKTGALALVTGAVLALGCTGTAAAVPDATLKGSRAIAPPGAPREVRQMIHAGNRIRHKPYVYGGGHSHWRSHGYDCSGSVSYVLHGAGLLDYPLDSTGFMHWGRKSGSKWVTIFANHGHAFMVVAGLRFDTSYITDGDKSGPGWSEEMRPTKGFRARSPGGVSRW